MPKSPKREAIGIHMFAVDTTEPEDNEAPSKNTFIVSIHSQHRNMQLGPTLSRTDIKTIQGIFSDGTIPTGTHSELLWNVLDLMRICPEIKLRTLLTDMSVGTQFRVYKFYPSDEANLLASKEIAKKCYEHGRDSKDKDK